jgi:hypothetical protein
LQKQCVLITAVLTLAGAGPGALAPSVIVATTRPEFRPPWEMRSHHATISLTPLDRAQVRDMIAELSARHALPREVVDNVAARTGGVPLFVEEVTRLLLERGEKGGIHVIPPSLQQSLMARLGLCSGEICAMEAATRQAGEVLVGASAWSVENRRNRRRVFRAGGRRKEIMRCRS